MLTWLFVYLGGMFTALVFNYLIHEPNKRYEEQLYRNSGHYEEV